MNDLWKYDASTNQWTWMKGTNLLDQVGIYGTLGIAAPTNAPGGREGAAGWLDSSGNLWMLGGAGFPSTTATGRMNDLWKYDPATNHGPGKKALIWAIRTAYMAPRELRPLQTHPVVVKVP